MSVDIARAYNSYRVAHMLRARAAAIDPKGAGE